MKPKLSASGLTFPSHCLIWPTRFIASNDRRRLRTANGTALKRYQALSEVRISERHTK
jgi:hypothetical protein